MELQHLAEVSRNEAIVFGHRLKAIESGFLGDGLGLAAEVEAVVLDRRLEGLGHLVLVERGADLQRDCGLAAQRIAGAANGLADWGEVAFGGFQQVLALPGPQARQFRIAADHQAFAWILQRGDRGHVPLVEQVEPKGAGVEKRPDRRSPQGGDPVESGRLDLFVASGLGDHARSPTSATRFKPKRSLTLAIWTVRVLGLPVSPSNTSTAPGSRLRRTRGHRRS